MAMTQDQQRQNEDEFSAGFNEPDVAKQEQSEDEAFGLTPEPQEAPAVQEAASQSDDAASAGEGGAPDGNEGAPAVAIVVEPGAADGPDSNGDGPTDPKDIQRQKTWEGRLKAKEEELKAREEAMGKSAATDAPHGEQPGSESPAAESAEEMAEGESPAQEAAESPVDEKIEEVVEQVQSGEMTIDEAMSTLTQDFGPDMTKMLKVMIQHFATDIASKTADEKVGAVSKSLDGIVNEIVGDKARAHFESIEEAHPDFMEVAESDSFKSFVDAMPEADKQKAMQVIGSGSARQINRLINAYKAANKGDEQPADAPAAQDKPDSSAMDAAEGVRSAGLKLPNKPAESQDYEDAWNQF